MATVGGLHLQKYKTFAKAQRKRIKGLELTVRKGGETKKTNKFSMISRFTDGFGIQKDGFGIYAILFYTAYFCHKKYFENAKIPTYLHLAF